MRLAIVLIVLFISACASGKKTGYTTYNRSPMLSPDQSSILPVNTSHPIFMGKPKTDGTASPGTMAYSGAAGIAGLIAQIATQSAITDSEQSSRKSKQQQEADKVLTSFPSISGITAHDLTASISGQEFLTDNLTIEASPVYFISEDHKVSLSMVVDVHDKNGNSLYRNLIKAFLEEERATDSNIILISRLLFTATLNIADKDIRSTLKVKSNEYKSYSTDGMFERGQELHSVCNELLIRNLRHWVIAVFPNTDLSTCKDFNYPIISESSVSTQQQSVHHRP